MFVETIEAVFKAALPVGALGYLLTYWSIKSGRLSGDGNIKAMRAELKAMKQERKAEYKAAKAERKAQKKAEKKALKVEKKAGRKAYKLAAKTAKKNGEDLPQKIEKKSAAKEKLTRRMGAALARKIKPTGNPVHDKWMKFGGGFYGIVALWTYVVIELQEIYQFLMAFTGLSGIADLLSIDLLIGFLINSLINFVRAIAWFGYWPEVLGGEWILLWLIVAYGGYLGGLQLARRRWPARLWE